MIRTLPTVILLSALPTLPFAQESAFPAEDYASAERCAALLLELGMQSDANPLARSLARQTCIASRLEDQLSKQMAGEDATVGRSVDLGSGTSNPNLDDIKISIRSAREERDRLFEELSQMDPHEANELLKRLLGPSPDKSG